MKKNSLKSFCENTVNKITVVSIDGVDHKQPVDYKENCQTWYIEAQDYSYRANDLTQAMKMWAADGQRKVFTVGSIG